MKSLIRVITVFSIHYYCYLPFSHNLIYAVQHYRFPHLYIYLAIEQVFLFSLLRVSQTHTILLSLFTSTSHLYLATYDPNTLASLTEEPYLQSLILETFTNVAILSLAARISRPVTPDNLATHRRDIAAWLLVVVVQILILRESRIRIPFLQILNPGRDVSFLTFYRYNLFLFTRLALHNRLIPIVLCVTPVGEMLMGLIPGSALPLVVTRHFFDWRDEMAWAQDRMFEGVVVNQTWKMTCLCFCLVVMTPVVYIPWVLLEYFAKLTKYVLQGLVG